MSVRGIGRDGLLLLAGEALSRLALFGCAAYLARRLGPAGFGLVTFAQAVLGYVLLAGDWGLSTYGVRTIAARPAEAALSWPGIARLRVGVTLAGVAVAAIATLLAHPAPQTAAVLLGTIAIALPTALLADWAFRGLGRMGAAAVVAALPAVGWLAGSLLFVHGPEQLVWVPVLRFAGTALAALAGFVLLGGFPAIAGAGSAGARWVRERGAGRVLGSGGVLLFANVAVLVYNNADHLMLRGFLGDTAVGLYGSAYRVIQLPMAALYTLTASALPALVRLEAEGGGRAQATTRRLLAGAAALGLVAAALVWTFRAGIVQIVFGPAYAEAGPVLAVLALVIPLDFFVSVKGTGYIAAGRERGAGACAGIAAVCNVAANFVVIPRLGMLGAAWVTVATYVILGLLYVVFMDRGREPIRRIP